jgi:hypothetical protein
MKLLIAGIALAALGVACGGDDSPTDVSPAPGTSSPQATAAATSQAATAEPTAKSANAEPTQQPTAQPFEGGTDPVVAPPSSNEVATVVDVRAAVHGGFDRIVFEFAGDEVPGYKVEYVDAAAACGSGEPVVLPGPATLSVELRPAAAHDDDGESTVDVSEIELGGGAITKAESTCDFEAIVVWAVGMTGERPFNVFELGEPARLVIDIANAD